MNATYEESSLVDSFSNFIINVPSHDEEHISPLSSKEKCNADLRRFDTLLDMEIGTEAFCTSVDFDRNTRNMTEHFVNAYMLDETPLAPERTNSQNSGIYDRVDVVNPHNRGIDLLPLLRKNEDSKTIMTTVIPGNATGEEGRANQLDVAKRSYLDALTRGRE